MSETQHNMAHDDTATEASVTRESSNPGATDSGTRGSLDDAIKAATGEKAEAAPGKSGVFMGYLLQALGFIVGLTFIAAVIVAYIKRDEAGDSWVASHYRWQIRTFWFSLLWMVLGAVLTFFVIGWLILIFAMIWTLYRIIRGWLCFADGRPMYT